ncbi:MAG: GTPase domain-containing protein [Propionibacteriaceae bacterium]|nr:GTPase domain-containing protein [Propionibacteriaceae bacterium]
MSEALSALLSELRENLEKVWLALPLPGAVEAKQWTARAMAQLDDYVLPRLGAIEAPLLAVVGGSTGAGKSTLVNSLLGMTVTVPGVIRPTTRTPVLVHHPSDGAWFNSHIILPGFARYRGPAETLRAVQTVACSQVPAGLALLDAPDVDSVDVNNRALAVQLLAAADMWLFVTSAARYADAVPWEHLTQAAERSTAVAVIVDRVPPAALSIVPEHLAQMMTERGLGDAALFAVPETVADARGILPPAAVAPIRSWLEYLASSRVARAQVVMRTLDGAVASIESGLAQVANQITAQDAALKGLRDDAEAIFDAAKQLAKARSSDGSMLRGEVMARWQDFVGTGNFMRAAENQAGRLRDRITRAVVGSREKAQDVKVAVQFGLEALVVEAGEAALERVKSSWEANPAGRHLIEWAKVDIGLPAREFVAEAEAAMRLWQQDVVAIVTTEGATKRTRARLAALGVNIAGVSLMLLAFAHTAGLAGAELGIAGGTAIVAQKILELIFGDEAIRRLAAIAEEKLTGRIDEVLDAQLQRLYALTLDHFPVEVVKPETLRSLAQELEGARAWQMARLEELATYDREFVDDQTWDDPFAELSALAGETTTHYDNLGPTSTDAEMGLPEFFEEG